jgi:hypothetical protein
MTSAAQVRANHPNAHSHFTLPTLGGPPKGGTPNVDGNKTCETNPICARSDVGGTPNGATAEEETCGTNPICGGWEAGSAASGTPAEE